MATLTTIWNESPECNGKLGDEVTDTNGLLLLWNALLSKSLLLG